MTTQDISEMVRSIGLPFAYYEFPDDTAQEPPFVCFLLPESDDVYADNENYADKRVLQIELYTDEKDYSLEKTVENVLRANELSYRRSEEYIRSEKMWQVTYETEVFVNECE